MQLATSMFALASAAVAHLSTFYKFPAWL